MKKEPCNFKSTFKHSSGHFYLLQYVEANHFVLWYFSFYLCYLIRNGKQFSNGLLGNLLSRIMLVLHESTSSFYEIKEPNQIVPPPNSDFTYHCCPNKEVTGANSALVLQILYSLNAMALIFNCASFLWF